MKAGVVVSLLSVLVLGPALAPASEETTVTALTAGELLFFPEKSAQAEVMALNRSQIAAEIAARLSQLDVRVGVHVQQGEVVARLDCRDNDLALAAQRAELERLQHQLEFSGRQVQRVEQLVADKSMGEAELDRQRTEYNTLSANLSAQRLAVAAAQLAVERCEIKAPFAGVVLERLANRGEMLAVGTPVLLLLQDVGIEVSAQIALGELDDFVSGQNYQFAAAGAVHDVERLNLLPYVAPGNRSREARFAFVQPTPVVAGTQGRLVWKSGQAVLPAHLLVTRNGENGFFTLLQGQARFNPVSSAREGSPIAVGLPPETEVIVDGRHGLEDGQRVRVR